MGQTHTKRQRDKVREREREGESKSLFQVYAGKESVLHKLTRITSWSKTQTCTPVTDAVAVVNDRCVNKCGTGCLLYHTVKLAIDLRTWLANLISAPH
ncbi:hypothetical protein FHG87_004109 [Trinorchestia longiramus]|nr:hypothetical protein FHG87_004109 [Trinorchestia longiramus]